MRLKSGLPYTIKYYKAAKLHITRYMCGKPLLSNDSGVSLINGFPKKLLYLKELVDGCIWSKRAVMTLLSYTRSIIPTAKEESKVEVNLSSITNKYSGKDYTIPK